MIKIILESSGFGSNLYDNYGNKGVFIEVVIALLPLIIGLWFAKLCWKKITFEEKKLLNEESRDETSLSKAIYNHGKDIVSEIKPTIDEYKQNHSTSKIDSSSFTIDEINSHTDRVKIDGLDYNYFSKLKETKFNYLTEDEIYEKVMLEIEEDKKVKSTWGKALSQSDGNRDKAEAIYIKERVLFFKNQQEIEQKQKEEEIKRKKEIEQKQKEEEIKRKKEIEQKQNNSLSDEKLKIIGIGSGASKIVEFIQSMNNGEFNCLMIDSNQIDLDTKQVSFKILLTETLMNGLNQIEQFKINSLDIFIGNVKSVTVIVTLGGTVGSISSLSIIRYLISKQINVNVITTKPFTWEGEERSLLANNFLIEVNKYNIYLKVFNNDDILDYENLSMKERFSLLDNNILQEIKKLEQVK